MLVLALMLPFNETKRLLEKGVITWESPWVELGEIKDEKQILGVLYNTELKDTIQRGILSYTKNAVFNENKLILLIVNTTKNIIENVFEEHVEWEFEVHKSTHISKRMHIYDFEKYIFKIYFNEKLRKMFSHYSTLINIILILLLPVRAVKINYESPEVAGEAIFKTQPYITSVILLQPQSVSHTVADLAKNLISKLLKININKIYSISVT